MKLRHLFAITLILSGTATAGSKGFSVVMVNVGDPTFFESSTYKTYRSGDLSGDLSGDKTLWEKVDDCWNQNVTGGESIRHKTRIKLPPGMTVDLAKSIWNGDKKAFLAAQKILLKGQDFNKEHYDYDGMYIFRPQGNTLFLMSIGTRDNAPSKKFKFELDPNSPQNAAAQFDLALCKASGPIGVGFVP